VVAIDPVEPGGTLLAVAENGYGKRSAMDEYRRTHRGGKGIITMKTTDKTGRVIGVRMVTDDDQVMLVTSGGKVIRLRASELRVIGRNTQGVRLIELEEGERLAAVARVAEREEEAEGGGETPAEPAPDSDADAEGSEAGPETDPDGSEG
jgi:DNA gyrase subunit A